jgi:hypothetical protein
MDALQALVSLISGGLAGACVNALITSRKQKLDVTLSIIKDFFSIYEDIGRVKGLFASADIKAMLDDPNNRHIMRRVGDWFHYVSSLVAEGTANSNLLDKVGVTKEAQAFLEAVTTAKVRCPEHLESAWSWWPNLKDFG